MEMGFLIALLEKLLFFVGFVGGANSFPKPLSKADEEKYTKLLKEGDEGAKNVLIEHNLRLVAHIAKKYGNENDFDDLVSIGTIGLIKGINTYNPDKNTRLAAYIARCIENEILMTMRRQKRLSREISLDETIGSDNEGNNMTLADTLSTAERSVEEEVFLKINSRKLLKAIESALTPSEQKIIIWRYGLDGENRKTQQEVSELLGISRSYVSRIEKKALKKLSSVLN
ncbi:MAG: RNA polymerase sporulation sigma factor SigK [Clostridia bacterium]|nr:RNA polymerase sporulation sigma factor SigK [Clostridia bacterium]